MAAARFDCPVESGLSESANVSCGQENAFDIAVAEHGSRATFAAARLAFESQTLLDPSHAEIIVDDVRTIGSQIALPSYLRLTKVNNDLAGSAAWLLLDPTMMTMEWTTAGMDSA